MWPYFLILLHPNKMQKSLEPVSPKLDWQKPPGWINITLGKWLNELFLILGEWFLSVYTSVKQVQILGGAVFYHPLYFKMTGQNCQYASSAWCHKGPLKAPPRRAHRLWLNTTTEPCSVSGVLKLGFFLRDPKQFRAIKWLQLPKERGQNNWTVTLPKACR